MSFYADVGTLATRRAYETYLRFIEKKVQECDEHTQAHIRIMLEKRLIVCRDLLTSTDSAIEGMLVKIPFSLFCDVVAKDHGGVWNFHEIPSDANVTERRRILYERTQCPTQTCALRNGERSLDDVSGWYEVIDYANDEAFFGVCKYCWKQEEHHKIGTSEDVSCLFAHFEKRGGVAMPWALLGAESRSIISERAYECLREETSGEATNAIEDSVDTNVRQCTFLLRFDV
jgi:hypothetical protein